MEDDTTKGRKLGKYGGCMSPVKMGLGSASGARISNPWGLIIPELKYKSKRKACLYLLVTHGSNEKMRKAFRGL